MTPISAADPTGPLYRIDSFEVPADSLSKFMHRVRWIQRYLDSLAGCRQNLVLAQVAGPGRFNVVTLVEWEDRGALVDAQQRVQEHYRNEGFDPAALMARLGVRAHLGTYAPAQPLPVVRKRWT